MKEQEGHQKIAREREPQKTSYTEKGSSLKSKTERKVTKLFSN